MSWALIAGGSRGIGLGIAIALAKRNTNLILIARNLQDLSAAKNNLEIRFSIQVEILSCDLSMPESAFMISDWCSTRGLEINILCHAAGIGGSTDFPDLPLTDLRTMIRLNLESAITLSLGLLPLLKKYKPSYLLNVGSMAGFAPIPIKNVYASTKSALLSFSYSLKYLLKEYNISVSCLCPGPVFTKPSIEKETIKQLGWLGKHMAMDATAVGEMAIRGMLNRKMIIVPGKLAAMVSFFLRIMPRGLLLKIFYSYRSNR
jgi:short-subunit dehydrogenase